MAVLDETDLEKPRGQAYVEWLSADTLSLVTFTQTNGPQYVSVDLRNQANAEANAVGGYHGRYLFELVQNANDAILAIDEFSEYDRGSRQRIRIELTQTALIVANDGVPFLEEDVDSIYRWGESSKDPNKSIGYKGIGFKSVLQITDAPEIFSRVVQFRFDRETCYREVRAIVGDDVDLRLPITRFVFPYAIDQIDTKSDRALVRSLLDEERFSTVIRLPVKAPHLRENVLERIGLDLDPALLLFLQGIDEIDIWLDGERKKTLRRRVRLPKASRQACDVTLYVGDSLASRWLLFTSPKVEIRDRSITKSLRDNAWERVHRVGFSIAFPLDHQGRLQPNPGCSTSLFVYFPTEVNSGLQYRIHGDFYIDAARKQVEDRSYNRWLAVRIAEYLSTSVVPELVEHYPADVHLVQALIPSPQVDGFARQLQSEIVARLRTCCFVPGLGDTVLRPDCLLFAPPGASADLVHFQRFFPVVDLSARNDGRHFPIPAVEEDSRSTEFLIELGACQLGFEDVFALCGANCTLKIVDTAQFYDFLWQWYEQLDRRQRRNFVAALSAATCVVVDSGAWIRPHERLYHAKLRQETPAMPSALHADIVLREAYGGEGRSGGPHRILSALSPPIRDYDARDIILHSIIPLFDGTRFQRLSLDERAEIYRFLFDYWQNRRNTRDTEVERVKGQVLVPARSITNRRKDAWLPASTVYLSSVWGNDDRLERLYEGFDDIAFLYDVRGLEVSDDDRPMWTRFWKWLGISAVPRLLVDEVSPYELSWDRWRQIQRRHAHAGTAIWLEYLEYIKQNFAECKRHGPNYRQLRRSVALERFADFVENREVGRLRLLYALLAENWVTLKRAGLPKAQVHCYRKDCPNYARTDDVPSFFEYVLHHAEWIPAYTYVNGEPEIQLYRPSQCWFVSQAESPLIRNLLPTPVLGYAVTGDRQFCHDIRMRSVSEAGIVDLLDLLRSLPERYPDPNVAVSSGRRMVPQALATLSRWVLGRINNLLVQSGSTEHPDGPLELPLIASESNQLRYVRLPAPVFSADDRHHSARWRHHVPFAVLDRNWGAVAEFLGIKPISQHVTETCVPGLEIEEASQRLDMRFRRARPYLLAAVNDQRKSETEDVARYLSNLRIRVVDRLVVHRCLNIPSGKCLVDGAAKVYLEETAGSRAGSAGRAPRQGLLYVREGYAENFDLLAGPIAEFIRIPGLADAFVILLNRGGRDGRLRYLGTRGLIMQDVDAMRDMLSHLGVSEETGLAVEEDDGIALNLLKRLETSLEEEGQLDSGKEASTQESEHSPDSVEPDGKQVAIRSQPTDVEFPETDMSQVTLIPVTVAQNTLPTPVLVPGGRRSRGGKRDWERDQRLRDAYGKRGERLAKAVEIKRLRSLGLDDPESYVRWLREEGDETADHDFESVDLIDGELAEIAIEVKATPGREFRFPMSRPELGCARRWGNRYRLYRVTAVASAAPRIYVYGNPYVLWQQGQADIEPRDTYVTLPSPDEEGEP